MKYNMSQIMKRAWELRRCCALSALTFGGCLRRAWAEAKKEMEANRYNGREFVNGMAITMNGVTRTLNRWTKNGMDRVYINFDRKNDGYIDLVSGRRVLNNKYEYLTMIADAVAAMTF